METPDSGKLKYGGARNQVGGMLGIFKEIRTRATFDWRDVDDHLYRAASMAVCESGHAMMISQASGGLGVIVKIFINKRKAQAVATTGAEFDAIMAAVIADVHMQGGDWAALTDRSGDELRAAD